MRPLWELDIRWKRIALTLGCALFGAVISWIYWRNPPQSYPSDFSIAWAGARELRSGGNPYAIVGPGRPHGFPFPLLYPLPAILVAWPFSYLPLASADRVFVAVGAGLLAWALTQTRLLPPSLLVFTSMAFVTAAQVSQWSPWLTAAALMPSLGFLLAAKPTIGAALWIAYPSMRSFLLPILVVALTVMIWPWWPAEWFATLSSAPHLVPPVTRWGGPLILLGLLKWRTPEARLLVAMGCLPQTPILYDAIPLFLIAKTLNQGLFLMVGSLAVVWVRDLMQPATYEESLALMGQLIVYFLYLPCVVMILRGNGPSLKMTLLKRRQGYLGLVDGLCGFRKF